MPQWTEGDHVRVLERPVTDEDRKKNRYFAHMAGLCGTVAAVYNEDEISVRVDIDTMGAVAKDVHKIGNQRMRDRFLNETSEAQKKALSPEELDFNAHYVLLVMSSDLEKI